MKMIEKSLQNNKQSMQTIRTIGKSLEMLEKSLEINGQSMKIITILEQILEK